MKKPLIQTYLSMKKEKPLLNHIEKAIIKYIDSKVEPITANEIASNLDMSYVTANKYLKKLVEKKVLLIDDGKKNNPKRKNSKV